MDSFTQFRDEFSLKHVWPILATEFSYYLAYMSKRGYAYTTVRSYVAGISFFNKLNNFEDVTQKFVIVKILEGFKRSRPSKDARLPISRDLLAKFIKVTPVVCITSIYKSKLFSAAFSITFHGLFRIGEITKDSQSKAEHFIRLQDITMFPDRVEVCVPSSKTDQLGRGTTVVIPSQRDINVCPVKKLKEYLLVRGSYSGPLFCHFDKIPLSRYQFNAVLKKALAYLNIPAQGYKNHSFRIGMATALCADGRSDEEIKRMGRWKSSAFQGYIRVC